MRLIESLRRSQNQLLQNTQGFHLEVDPKASTGQANMS